MMQIKLWSINFILLLIFSIAISIVSMSESSSAPANVYIVYTELPSEGSDHESFHLRTLSNVVGSEEAAKDSLIYVYKNAATGFSAKLTPEQVSELQKQPGVLHVAESKTIQLHKGGSGEMMNNMAV